MPDKFHILVVCSANVCRSPLAARVLTANVSIAVDQQRVPPRLMVVSSAGRYAVEGEPMCAQSAALAGMDPQHHASRKLTPELLAESNLVLALDSKVAAACAQLQPDCAPRLFTLREAQVRARAAAGRQREEDVDGGDDLTRGAQRLGRLVEKMDAVRRVGPPPAAGSLEIPDAHLRGDHRATLRRVMASADDLAGTLIRAA